MALGVTFPARGTWIEISVMLMNVHGWGDVPRKGNVDRNSGVPCKAVGASATFPARGTWIEMPSN